MWTVVVLIGVAANVRPLTAAFRRRRPVRCFGPSESLRVLARQSIRSESVTLAVQCLLATLTRSSGHTQGAGAGAGAVRRDQWLAAVALSVALIDLVLDRQDQKRLYRQFIYRGGRESGEV